MENTMPNIGGLRVKITLMDNSVLDAVYYGQCEDGVIMIDEYRGDIQVLRELMQTDIKDIQM